MSEIDRHGSEMDPTYDRSQPGKYVPYENIDRAVYEVIHPENAMARLGMSARTAYRKIDSGEIEYTLEKGSKRILVRKDQTSSENNASNVGQLTVIGQNRSDKMTDIQNMGPMVGKLIDNLPDFKEMLAEREEDIRALNEEIRQLRGDIDNLKLKHRDEIESVRQGCQTRIEELRTEKDDIIYQLRLSLDELKSKQQEELQIVRQTCQKEIDHLKASLEAERIDKARMEGDVKRIETIQGTVEAQKETITSQKTTIEALNNERIVITQQLQKYRGHEEQHFSGVTQERKPPSWMFWAK